LRRLPFPPTLSKSELFATKRAHLFNTGRVAIRQDGSKWPWRERIFLDEIGDLSAEVQGQVPPRLQEGEFEAGRIVTGRGVDVRVLPRRIRTSKPLSAEGRFRARILCSKNTA
jgi:transcriptional regulator with GAF, ATPase, and Fis domain